MQPLQDLPPPPLWPLDHSTAGEGRAAPGRTRKGLQPRGATAPTALRYRQGQESTGGTGFGRCLVAGQAGTVLGRHVRLKWVGELIDMRALSWGRGFSMLAKTTARRWCKSATRMGSRSMGKAMARAVRSAGVSVLDGGHALRSGRAELSVHGRPGRTEEEHGLPEGLADTPVIKPSVTKRVGASSLL